MENNTFRQKRRNLHVNEAEMLKFEAGRGKGTELAEAMPQFPPKVMSTLPRRLQRFGFSLIPVGKRY